MAVRKCLECKYFVPGSSSNLGKCKLHYRSMWPDETCCNFTCKDEPNNSGTDRLKELEERVSKLERLVVRLL